MDSKYLIERGRDSIAGFKHTIDGEEQEIWCSECAIKDIENRPYIAEETDLALPSHNELEGSIGPIMYEFFDQHKEMKDGDGVITQDLSDTFCDQCDQPLHPT
jgi:Zn finger protein HypA/HybF involved in hydrogenase expression